jgi:hypothetical protein
MKIRVSNPDILRDIPETVRIRIEELQNQLDANETRVKVYAEKAKRLREMQIEQAVLEWRANGKHEDLLTKVEHISAEHGSFVKKMGKWELDLDIRIPQMQSHVAELRAGMPAEVVQSTGDLYASEHEYAADHAQTLARALSRLGLLPDNQELPRPTGLTRGKAERSCVYFIYLRHCGIHLVAKFDDPERARREWDILEEFQTRNVSSQVVLPYKDNNRQDGVIIYRDVRGAIVRGQCCTLEEYLQRQVPSAVDHCEASVDLVFKEMGLDYGTGNQTSVARDGTNLSWKSMFPKMGEEGYTDDVLLPVAEKVWPEINWKGTQFQCAEIDGKVRRLPNPFQQLEAILAEQTGRIKVSRIHGDLNLTNILVSENHGGAPEKTFILDLARSAAEKATAMDFAQMEREFWKDVYLKLAGAFGFEESCALKNFIKVRDSLDGRIPYSADELPLWTRRARRFVHRLRVHHGQFHLWPCHPYYLNDFFYCLYLSSIAVLPVLAVRNEAIEGRLTIVGAALALEAIQDLKRGRYGPDRDMKLESPTRPLSDPAT